MPEISNLRFSTDEWNVDDFLVNVKILDEEGNIIVSIFGYDLAIVRRFLAAPEMYDELYEALQLCEGKSSYGGDEFAKQAKSIRELLARIDGKEDNHD